jgi:hypothetical protein
MKFHPSWEHPAWKHLVTRKLSHCHQMPTFASVELVVVWNWSHVWQLTLPICEGEMCRESFEMNSFRWAMIQ